ncbi:hypothetical protein [Streptomyces exfoliatus]|uniref:hypothetical protein n=1 Tax=Streptomyces exfoliatus TaxID=1905 RepID=UPI0004676080|nr:hypothetical protein [Streptomyces exfoliatus]
MLEIMTNRNGELAALTRQAVDTAVALRLLVARMHDLGCRMNDYSREDLLLATAVYSAEDVRAVTSALRGTAMIIVMDAGEGALLSDLTELLRNRGYVGQP